MFPNSNLRPVMFGASLILLIAVAGCSSVTVNYDYDQNTDFSKLKTYGWLDTKGGQSLGTTPGLAGNDLAFGRISNAIVTQLEQRGMTESDTPDVHVIYHLGTEDKIQVTDWGYNYSNYYWGYGGRQVDVSQYTQGTLIIDIIDNESDNLIWRGTGTGVVDESQRTPEEMNQKIQEVVAKIMASFPPK